MISGLSAIAQSSPQPARGSNQPEAKAAALQTAQLKGWSPGGVAADGTVTELMQVWRNKPMYYTTCNANGAAVIKSDKVYPGGGAGLNLTGSGIVLGIWDGGRVSETHPELTGRVVQQDGAVTISDHATHVAGTMIAQGIDASARGMSYQAGLNAYDWNDDDQEMSAGAAAGLKVSQHSYGYITGWQYGNYSGNTNWHWFGDPAISQTEDYYFGFYDATARLWDSVAHAAPHYLIVKSAGNDRGQGPSPGTAHYVYDGSNWVLSTQARDVDGGATGYDCIGHNSLAKNILTIGAVDNSGNMSWFSAWGPTDDGRIKPDVVAKGVNVYSSGFSTSNIYTTKSGTSMSGPMVSGSAGLLLQHRENLHPGLPMLSSTLKALIIHTANDLIDGVAGPDYRYGWGMMDTEKAALLMSADVAGGGIHIYELDLNDGETMTLPVKSSGSQSLRATIVWNDVPGTPPPPSLNPTTTHLVNDLDLRLTRSDNTTYSPYILDPANPSAAATAGDNSRDNVEMVHISSPGAGEIYSLTVGHKGSLSGGSQQFSLIISGNEAFDYIYLTQGADDASNYTQSDFVSEGSLGSGFGDWHTQNSNGGWFRAPASEQGSNSGQIDTGGNSFGLWASNPGFSDVGRQLAGNLPDGHRFSFQLAYQWDNGNRGFVLCNGDYTTEVFNWNVNSSGYTWTGGGSAPSTPWGGWRENGVVMDFSFTRDGSNINYNFSSPAGGGPSGSGTLAASAFDRIKFYVSDAGGGTGANFYFNHLEIEPLDIPTDATCFINQPFVLSNNFEAQNLTILNGGSLYVQPGVRLTVNGTLGNLNSQQPAQAFVLASDATATASLKHQNSGVQATAQRYIPAANWNDGNDGWHFVSSPAETQAVGGDWTPTGTGNDYDFYAWDETNATEPWRNQKDGANLIQQFIPGLGYLTAYQQTGTKTFAGGLNAGNVGIALSHNGSGGPEYTPGWNLLGNPYASAIDWNLADKSQFADDFAYIYNTSKNGGAGYEAIDGGNAGAIIPLHQGFFVMTENWADGETFSFSNSLRVHGGYFLKQNSGENQLVLKLSMGEISDETTIRLEPGSTIGRDRRDALKLFSFNPEIPQLFSLSSEETHLQINTIPAISDGLRIPLSIKAGLTGLYTLQLALATGNFAEQPVSVYDNYSGSSVNLHNLQGIPLNLSAGWHTNRFVLLFGSNAIPSAFAPEIRVYGHHDGIIIESGYQGIAKVEVLMLTGQLIFSANVNLHNIQHLPVSLRPGVYIVRIETAARQSNKKILIY